MENLKPLCIAGDTVKWCSCYGNGMAVLQKKLKVGLPYDPALLLLGI